MRLGIFTHYFPYGVDDTARRIRGHGFDCVQLNLTFADWRFGEEMAASECRRIRDSFARHDLGVAAIAGYVNPIARDPRRRQANLRLLRAILTRAGDLGSQYVVTESGSLHPDDDWAPHPDNGKPEALALLTESLRPLVDHAARAGAVLLLEPSIGNVVDTPEKARRLVDAIDGPSLGLVADHANYVDGANIDDADAVLERMFAATAGKIKLAHSKDARRLDGAPRERHHHPSDPRLYGGVEYPASGLGDLNHGRYLALLARHCPDAPLILEHIEEADVPRAKKFIDDQPAANR